MWRGRDGIRIQGFGLAVRILVSESASVLAGSEALDGAGAIGDSTGITDIRFMAVPGTIRGAERFITGTIFTTVELTERMEEPMAHTEALTAAAEFTTVRERVPGLSKKIGRQLEDTLRPMDRAVSTQTHSVAMITADRPAAFRRGDRPAWERLSAGAVALMAAGDHTVAAVIIEIKRDRQ